MGKAGRTIRWLVALALIAVAVLWPLVPRAGADEGGGTADPVTITDYRADYHVSRDGDLLATETITGEFPGGRHGIFRYWDVADPDNPHARQVPSISSVLMDGRPITYEMLWERARFRVAKIGIGSLPGRGRTRLRDPLHDSGCAWAR